MESSTTSKGIHDLDIKAKGLRDTAQHLTEIHGKCLKAAKSMAVLGEETLKFAQSLTDYANYLSYSQEDADINLRQALLSVADFFRYQETMRSELNGRLAEYFSGPINNFCNLEIKEALDMRRKVENSWTAYEASNSKVRKLQKQNNMPKLLEEQRHQQALRDDYDKTFGGAYNRMHEVTQMNRIYLPEKLIEYLEFQRDFMWQNFTHLDNQSEQLTNITWKTIKLKEELRATNPQGCGSSLQGSSVSYLGDKAVSRPAKRLVNLEKLKALREEEYNIVDTPSHADKEKVVQEQASAQVSNMGPPTNVLAALQSLQQQVSSLNITPEYPVGGSRLVPAASAGIVFPLCAGCSQPIKEQGLSALDKQWHPLCFVCGVCRRPFGNAPFFIHEGVPYCETDYGKAIGVQAQMVCGGCNQGITGPYIKAMNKFWHQGHFVCAKCHGGLQGGFWEISGQPYCPECSKAQQK